MSRTGRIAIYALCAVCLDLLFSFVRPSALMAPRTSAFIGEWGMNLSLVVVPTIILLVPARRYEEPSLSSRFMLSILATWYALVVFRTHFNLPGLRELAQQADNYRYDGVGMNAAILAMGWVPSLLSSTIVFLLVPAIQQSLGHAEAVDDGVPNRDTMPSQGDLE